MKYCMYIGTVEEERFLLVEQQYNIKREEWR